MHATNDICSLDPVFSGTCTRSGPNDINDIFVMIYLLILEPDFDTVFIGCKAGQYFVELL